MMLHRQLMFDFLYWLSGFMPCRIINDGDNDYLERYYLYTYRGRHYYLHLFWGSDPDRGLHNHKWHGWSVVLCGWYWEERAWGRRKIRLFNSLTPDTYHRVVLPTKWRKQRIESQVSGAVYNIFKSDGLQPCWTLFSHRAENDVPHWGFRREMNDPENPGAWFLQPYKYEREGNQENWWLTAPTGREMRARA